MNCSRRAFLGLGAAAGLVAGYVPSTEGAEPLWLVPRDVDEFGVLADEIVTVGSHLRALDAATGQERRSARLRKPSDAEGPATVAVAASAIVFGWYVWQGDVHILSADPRSLQIRWQRRIKVADNERQDIPYVFPLVRSDGVFVLVSSKLSENLFRLRPENGETVWSRYVERFAAEAPLAWYGNRLLVRSRITRGPSAFGRLHALEPTSGATLWRVELEGHEDAGGDTMLISGNRVYIASPVYPGESSRLHIVDLATGALVKSLSIDRLSTPFASHDGVVYFGGNTPTAWDVSREQVLWRTDLRERRGRLLFISPHAVFDSARRRIYLGESEDSFFVLSATDGTILGTVDVRRGHTNLTRLMGGYGAYRLRLMRDRLLIGAGDQRLLAYATASL